MGQRVVPPGLDYTGERKSGMLSQHGARGWQEPGCGACTGREDVGNARRSEVGLSRKSPHSILAFAFLISLKSLEGSMAQRGLIILSAISTPGSRRFFLRLIIDNANAIINI